MKQTAITNAQRTNSLPRWRGFNFLGMFLPPGDKRFSDMRPLPADGFCEKDFALVAELGFDFVRLPLCYWHWSSPEHPEEIRDSALKEIDRAVEWARQYRLHLSLNFHHAPGYCVNEPIRPEPFNLWLDDRAREVFCLHWSRFASRYRDIPSAALSFDLVNEPPGVGHGGMTREHHERVIRDCVKAIRSVDPHRLVIANGLDWGTTPITEFYSLGIAQSCRGYFPVGVSHFRAYWCDRDIIDPPRWPGASHIEEKDIGPEELARFYQPWAAAVQEGVGIHCGEMGCWNQTPHTVAMAWMRDLLGILHQREIGWALWNFRGSFGILDSARADVRYERWRGYLLDREMLELLQCH